MNTDDEVEKPLVGGNDREIAVMQLIKSVEDAWNDNYVKQEKPEQECKVDGEAQEFYVTRSGQISRH
jgi:hypothetical protein